MAVAGARSADEATERAVPNIYAVDLPIFEGPLDLLLHLVRRHELDILDIPIAFITQKYLEYLELMRALDVEIAGEYLVMAATLAYLKSRELLPRQDAEGEGVEGEEEGVDPREALIRRLVEYERFRAASAELDSMPVSGRDTFGRGRDIDLPPVDPGMAPVTLFRLAEAYARVLQRARISKSHEVMIEAVTVRQRMEQLSLLLQERENLDFEGLFLGRTWASAAELRAMLVVTLMSVLEMVKMGLVGVQQVPETTTITISRRSTHQHALALIAGYDEESSFGDAAAKPAAGASTSPAEAASPPAPEASEAGAPDQSEGTAAAPASARGAAARGDEEGAADDHEDAEDDGVEGSAWSEFAWTSPPAAAPARPEAPLPAPAIPWTEAGWDEDTDDEAEPEARSGARSRDEVGGPDAPRPDRPEQDEQDE